MKRTKLTKKRKERNAISRRMGIGFLLLMSICVVIGVVGIVNLNSLNADADLIATKYVDGIYDAQALKFHVTEMSHILHEFELGGINRTEADTVYGLEMEEFEEHLECLISLFPEYAVELADVQDDYDEMSENATSTDGIIDLFDCAREDAGEIHENFENVTDTLFDLKDLATNETTKTNISLMLYYVDMEVHAMHEYLGERNCTGPKDEITEANTTFNELKGFLSADPSLNQADIDKLVRQENLTEGILESLGDYDAAWVGMEFHEECFECVLGDMTEIVVGIEGATAIAIARTGATFLLGIIITIVCIIGAIGGGIVIARPTIKKITGIYNTVNKARESMKNVIDASSVVSLNVSNMATELAASASEVNASTEEIASSTTEVAQNIGSQVNSLSQISTRSRLIEELSKEILSSTDDINKIVKLITSISDQTNLLALNASIEAGRAGEQGRGFAVVADEVRKLAEESKSSIATTGDKINLIISRIAESNKYVAEITQDIQLSTASFEDTSQAIEGISSSAEEQTASMEEISATAAKLGAIAEELKTTLLKEREVTNKTSTSAGRIKK